MNCPEKISSFGAPVYVNVYMKPSVEKGFTRTSLMYTVCDTQVCVLNHLPFIPPIWSNISF